MSSGELTPEDRLRQLAARLVAEAGAPQSVVFLESGDGGPKVVNSDEKDIRWWLCMGWPYGCNY